MLLISMQMIADRITQYSPKLYLSKDDKPILKSVKLLSKTQTQFEKSEVYVFRAEDFQDKTENLQDSMQKQLNLICVGNSEILDAIIDDPFFSLIIINSDCELADIFNEVQNVFNVFNQFENELQESVIQEKGLQDLIDISYKIFKNPMYIINSAFMTLVSSKEVKSDSLDYLWRSIVEEGYVNLDFMNSLKDTMTVHYLNNFKTPTYATSKELDYRAIVSNMWINDKRVGRLVILDLNNSLNETYLYLADYLTKFICNVIQMDGHYKSPHGTLYEHFIIDQITGKNYDTKIIEYHLKQLSWKLKDSFYVLKVNVKCKDVSNKILEYNSSLIEKIFQGSLSVIYEESIIVIINTKKCIKSWENMIDSLKEFLLKNDLKGGMSNAFNDFSKLYEYNKQASAAVELGSIINDCEFLYFYQDYALFHMIQTCSKELNLMMFCHPKAIKIHEYDQMYNTNYLYFIYIYFIKDKSLINTSKILGIHRNSCVYRIKKITDLFNVDFENEQGHLILSYKIYEYMEKLETNMIPVR